MEFNIEKMSKALAECHGGACFSGCYLFDTAIKDEQMRCMNCLNIANEVIKKLTEENERLRACPNLVPTLNEVKADTVQKTQERLKALLNTDYINGTREHALSVIDQIAEELLEGKDEIRD